MKKLLVLFVAFLSLYGLKAQNTDFLEPCSGIFSDYPTKSEYYMSIHKILFKDLSNFPYARTLVCPSFQPEYLISIERNVFQNNNQRVFSKEIYLKYRTCNPSIWKSISLRNKSIVYISKEIEVDSTFAYTLEKLYNKAISQARFQHINSNGDGKYAGLNGVDYYFMAGTGFTAIACGKTSTPPENSKMYELKTITELLKNYAEKPDKNLKKEIQSRSEELTLKFDTFKVDHKATPTSYERYGWLATVIILFIINLVLLIRNKRFSNRKPYNRK